MSSILDRTRRVCPRASFCGTETILEDCDDCERSSSSSWMQTALLCSEEGGEAGRVLEVADDEARLAIWYEWLDMVDN